nr:hypothetical protein [Tanacetum cinerariifolium]
MEECHLLLTDQIDLVNLEGHRVIPDMIKYLPLGGPPGQVTMQPQLFFNMDLEYLVTCNKERRSALSISKLKDASDFLYKEDYTIVSKPKAIIYRDRNDQKMMMRETEVHKFSNGTLTRILERLDHMVKDFRLFKYNLGMEKSIWSEGDRRKSKEFMEVIERKLKIRIIFRTLKRFVSGRLRDVDYRLI